MNNFFLSYNPLIIIIAIGLTFIAAYTALDMFTLIKSSEKNKRYLFIGGSFSMGISIWIMNFMGIMATELNQFANYQVAATLFSIAAGIALTAIAFYFLVMSSISWLHLAVASFFLTASVFSIRILNMYSMNLRFSFIPSIMIVSAIMIYISFLFAAWILFYSRNLLTKNQAWLKPVSSFIISGAIIEGHFLLKRAMVIGTGQASIDPAHSKTAIIIYLVLFVALIIFVGLIASSSLLSKRLEVSDTNLRDIKAALDESSIVAITDPKGIITYVNDKFVEIAKYTEDEILGQNHRILNSGTHSKEFFNELWNTIKKGEIWRGDICNRAKDGETYWVNTTIVPFLDKKGRPYQYVAIRTDISNRKKAEEELRKTLKENSEIKFALDQSSIVAFTNSKGIITKVNDKFCEISKYKREELIGKDHNLLNSGYHSKAFFIELWKTIGSGNVWKGEIKNKAKDGTYYWVDTTIVPFMNESGKPYQYLAIRNDITERKRSEEILHRQDKLAAVGQLAAGVAHEIRNPLTSMKGYAEFLQLDEENPDRLEFLSIILDEIDRVNSIVEDFMVLAKPKAVILEEKNIVQVLKNVINLLEFEARKKNVQMHFDSIEEVIQIECDENRLKQVFLNLMKNGIEAMPAGGELNVRMSIEDENVQISIQDTGIGISQEKINRIGEPFYTTKKEGNGLGLMMSFKIIESHKGKIYIESELNKGTTFNILLPKKTA